MRHYKLLVSILACLTLSCAPQNQNTPFLVFDGFLPSPSPTPSPIPTPPGWLTYYDWQKIAGWCAEADLFAPDKPVNFAADQTKKTLVVSSGKTSLTFNEVGEMLQAHKVKRLVQIPARTPLSKALTIALTRSIKNGLRNAHFEITCTSKTDGYSILIMGDDKVRSFYQLFFIEKTGTVTHQSGGW